MALNGLYVWLGVPHFVAERTWLAPLRGPVEPRYAPPTARLAPFQKIADDIVTIMSFPHQTGPKMGHKRPKITENDSGHAL